MQLPCIYQQVDSYFENYTKMKNTKENQPLPTYLSYEHETHDNIVKTARYLNQQLGEKLKQFDLDLPLFNILRIIHSKSNKVINIKEIQSSMLHKMANTSRLIRVLEDRELIERRPSEQDKRVVNVFLTDKGTFVMEELDDLSAEYYTNQFAQFTKDELDTINRFLRTLRKT